VLRAPRSHPTAASLLVAGSLLGTGVLLLSGCGTPPELREHHAAESPATPTVAATQTAAPTGSQPVTPLPGPTTPVFGGAPAVRCAGTGGPSGAQVIALLHRSPALLSASAHATVATGPLCADDWQYTIVQVPDREPLQVVSRGRPGSLKLVTAGTDVCSIPVRTEAPPSIQTFACTEGTVPTAGA
jgi:hypothetical protein